MPSRESPATRVSRVMDRIRLMLGQAYALAGYFAWTAFRIRPRGMGVMERRIRNEHVIAYRNVRLHFSPQAAGGYAFLLSGHSNERGIIALLDEWKRKGRPYTLVDVGAHVGEISFYASRHRNVRAVHAFECHPAHLECLARGRQYNRSPGLVVHPCALSDACGTARFFCNAAGPTSSRLAVPGDPAGIPVVTRTLDAELPDAVKGDLIIKIDVEGHEASVLRGATRTLRERAPVVIFEHNSHLSPPSALQAVRDALGARYQIFRLRDDGHLDSHLDATVNCIAVPVGMARRVEWPASDCGWLEASAP
jgi:FkbM family methyltransferase